MHLTAVSPLPADAPQLQSFPSDVTQICDVRRTDPQEEAVKDAWGEEALLKQQALERDMHEAGAKLLNDALAEARTDGTLHNTAGGRSALRGALHPLAYVIGRFQEHGRGLLEPIVEEAMDASAVVASRRGRPAGHTYRTLLKQLPAESAALVTLRCMIGSAAMASDVEDMRRLIGTELEYMAKEASLDADQLHDIGKKAKNRGYSERGRRMAVAERAAQRGWTEWEAKPKGALADALIRACCLHTGLFETETRREGKKTHLDVVPTEALDKLFEDKHARAVATAAVVRPFVCPPRPWISPFRGAYWTREIGGVRLVKTRRKRHLDMLREQPMATVYRAVNAAQATAWRINPKVYETVAYFWEHGEAVGSGDGMLPSRLAPKLPPKPAKDCPKEELVAWLKETGRIKRATNVLRSKRLAVTACVETAKKYAAEPRMWFAYNLDFRGRMYPIQTALTPQGSNLELGLLEFAEGLPIKTQQAEDWLAIHGANEWGVKLDDGRALDKVSYAERIAWVHANSHWIEECGRAPRLNTQWMRAGKGKKPWKFLAFCIDWFGYMEAKRWGEEYVSHLPVSVDGTCNGLQHLSAMVRDRAAAESVNLIDRPQPADIYTVVAEIATDILRKEVQEGTPEQSALAQDILALGIDRDITKRPVMVIPYGGTMRACLNYVEEALTDKLKGIEPARAKAIKGHTAKVVWDAMGGVLGNAKGVMTWLMSLASASNKAGLPLYWTVPSGFLAYQEYKVTLPDVYDPCARLWSYGTPAALPPV